MAAGHDEQRLGVAGRRCGSRTVGEASPPGSAASAPASPSASTASPQTPQVTRSHGWVQPWPGSATPGLPRAAPTGASASVRPLPIDGPPGILAHMRARAAGTSPRLARV